MRQPRRLLLSSPFTLDALIVLALGTLGLVGELYWPEYSLAIVDVAVAIILLFVILR
jgi:hypothetical protein